MLTLACGIEVIARNNDEPHGLYSSTNIIMAITSRRRWMGYVARMGEISYVYKILIRHPKGTRPLERIARKCDDIMLLKWILRE
jgi:hypothetical protein